MAHFPTGARSRESRRNRGPDHQAYGRVGLASELTARGASTTETILAGGWKTARMVAHYSAAATVEQGAGTKYV